ncbi:hypothetical protein GGI43DRAFT_412007 [Trichoderma evansii]
MDPKQSSKLKGLLKKSITKPGEAPTNLQSKPKPLPEPAPEDTASPLAAITASVPNLAEPTAVTLNTLKQPKISLWDRAYDSLREKDKKLVEAYEELLSRQLQPGNNDEIHVKTESQIESGDHRIRLAQLEIITSNGLQQLDKKKARFNIFGHEFILRDQLAQATQFIQTIKDAIDVAVRASPEASLAWAGICVILPLFMNPSVAEEASRDGWLYVTSRIHFYVKLESLLLASNRLRNSGLDVELEDRLITLYRSIIDFQIRTVRRVYLTRLARLKEDTVQHENWKGMITKIQELEKMFSDDFTLVKDATMGKELEELNKNAEKLLMVIGSMLPSLLNNNRKESTFYFSNHGSGSQFNATTGGTQYNATGNSKQFNGATFHGTVTFN